jgi:ABC-type transporter Mla MlaB component
MTFAPETYHRVDVHSSAALARTQVTLLGVLDNDAIEEIEEAIELAEANEHTLTFELSQISSITPDALAALLTRSDHPYDGPLNFPPSTPSAAE